MKTIFSMLVASVLLCGCVSTVKYPPSGDWNSGVRELGMVDADSGAWPLSLNAPPPAETYYFALRTVAASKYSVAPNQIVLDDVSVTFGSEVVGTIRDWKATAEAGQDTNIAPIWPHVIEDNTPTLPIKSPRGAAE